MVGGSYERVFTRIADKLLEERLNAKGDVLIEGPKMQWKDNVNSKANGRDFS